MSQSYPGEKMTASGKWFNYTVTGVTKVNALITGADGKQYSKEQKLIAQRDTHIRLAEKQPLDLQGPESGRLLGKRRYA